jgi:hypothetical protein
MKSFITVRYKTGKNDRPTDDALGQRIMKGQFLSGYARGIG